MQKPAISRNGPLPSTKLLTIRNSSGDEIVKRDLMIHAGYGGLATLEESHNHTPIRDICSEGWSSWTIFVIFGGRVAGWPGYNMVKKIPEKLNPLSRVHARHRRQTYGFAMRYCQKYLQHFRNFNDLCLINVFIIKIYIFVCGNSLIPVRIALPWVD